MSDLFRRQLAVYAEYHRDARNCATHYVGIPAIFLGVVLPLALVRIQLGAVSSSLAVLLTAPALAGWIALDLGVGLAMLAAVVPLLVVAELVVRLGGPALAWSLAAGLFLVGWTLQIVGHAAFERRRPAFVDHLAQMFIGPMFMMTKLLLALGLRSDLMTPMQGAAEHRQGRRR